MTHTHEFYDVRNAFKDPYQLISSFRNIVLIFDCSPISINGVRNGNGMEWNGLRIKSRKVTLVKPMKKVILNFNL